MKLPNASTNFSNLFRCAPIFIKCISGSFLFLKSSLNQCNNHIIWRRFCLLSQSTFRTDLSVKKTHWSISSNHRVFAWEYRSFSHDSTRSFPSTKFWGLKYKKAKSYLAIKGIINQVLLSFELLTHKEIWNHKTNFKRYFWF